MVNVIGLGYIGLPTALMMAANGVEVVGTDCDKSLVDALNRGTTSFCEVGLDDLLREAVEKGIAFSSEYKRADVYIVSVPTPCDQLTGKVDASYIVSAVQSILRVCPRSAVIVIESTVSPGTIDQYIRPVIEERGFVVGRDIHLAHAPERIIPGNMIYELRYNDRTIGADDGTVGERIRSLYASFCRGEIVVTDIRTAEMTKIVENAFRAVNIAFANELAKICRHGQMDVNEIIRICNMHPRVNILRPGPGVGGHCIPVDPRFLVGDYPKLARLIGEAVKVNESMTDFVLDRICGIMEEKNIDRWDRVGLYGLSYKENVDDLRESPSLRLLECVQRRFGASFRAYDPYVEKDVVPNQYHDFNRFLEDTDLVVIMVAHGQLGRYMEMLKGKTVFDTRNCCDLPGIYRL
jgi:UDP-N-acetyl-D-mannosaminuronic acid dehydrogenase